MDIADRIKQGQSFLVADDGKFLGKLTLNKYDLESISNEYGMYGSKYALNSIKNQYSLVGSIYGLYSPHNQYSISPPKIYLRGTEFGYLTKNKYRLGNLIDPEELDDWMRVNNLIY